MSRRRLSRVRSGASELAGSLTWPRLLVDLAVVVGWTLLATVAFTGTGLPPWLYYLAVLGGVGAYTIASGR